MINYYMTDTLMVMLFNLTLKNIFYTLLYFYFLVVNEERIKSNEIILFY